MPGECQSQKVQKSHGDESSSFAPFPFAHVYSPLTLKEPNRRNEITRQFKLPPDLRSSECTPCLA